MQLRSFFQAALAAGLVCLTGVAPASRVGAAAVAQPESAKAVEDRQAHHVTVNASAFPWSSVAKLFNSVGGACTGSVIGRDQILTAAHCLYNFRTRRFLPPDAIHALLGYARGDYSTHARVEHYTIGPGYDPVAERSTAASDWAVLHLAEQLPDTIRPLQPADADPAPSTRLMVGGFARDRAFVMTADNDCKVLGLVAGGTLISHDCVIAPGDSGAPLLVTGSAGDVRYVGIAVGIWRQGGSQIGIATKGPPDPSRKPPGP